MAAGFIQTTVTTTTGETVELTFWSADTSNPTTANTFNVTSGAVAHDGADAVAPIKIGGYAKAAAPSDVSADADIVNAWFLRNGALVTALQAAGVLIGSAEDVASADGHGGIPPLYVRKATPANSSGTDGDYEFPQQSEGQQWVNNNLWQIGTNGFIKTPFNLQTTELNTLTNGSTVVSSVGGTSGVFSQTNTGRAKQAEIWITLGGNFAATPAAGANITGWFLKSTDGGTTFEDTNSNTALPRPPDFIIPLVAAAYSANDVVFAAGPVSLPSCAFKVWIQNNAGASASLAASGNILQMAPVA